MIIAPSNKNDKTIKTAYSQINAGNMKPIEDIIKLARAQYPYAEFILGELNELKFGNKEEAIKWYKAAANHGCEKAKKKYTELMMA